MVELESYFVSYAKQMEIRGIPPHQRFSHVSDAVMQISKHLSDMKGSYCPSIFKTLYSTLKSLIQTASDRDTMRKSEDISVMKIAWEKERCKLAE